MRERFMEDHQFTEDDVLSLIESVLLEANDEDGGPLPLLGCGRIGDGINIQFKGERRWWRLELRDVTALLEAAFAKPEAQS